MAHAVANEWRSQKEVILLSQVGITHTYFGRSKKVKSLVQQYLLLQMHMNGLVNTCLDNPQRLDKPKLVRSKIKELSCMHLCCPQVKQIMDFLETDTILFHCLEPPELLQLQADKWNPVLLWFRERC